MLILVMVFITAVERKLGQCLSLRPGAHCLGQADWPASSKSWLVPVCPVSSKSRLVPVSPELELEAYATTCVFYIWVLKDKLRSACFQLCISPVLWAPFLHGFPLLLTAGSPQDYLGRIFSGMSTILMPPVPLYTPLRTFYLFLGPFSVGFLLVAEGKGHHDLL